MKFDLHADIEWTVQKYHQLKVFEIDGKILLIGEVDIVDKDEMEIIDTFSVEIRFPEFFPYCFPKVMETSGKIPKIPDRHVFKDTGNLCFSVETEELILCRNTMSSRQFIDQILVPRLAEEYVINNGGNYRKERSHGIKGDVEYYQEKFDTQSLDKVILYLELILNGEIPKPYERCFCGSGKKFKKCHQQITDGINAFNKFYIQREIRKLELYRSNM
jgi:hypothetical protein